MTVMKTCIHNTWLIATMIATFCFFCNRSSGQTTVSIDLNIDYIDVPSQTEISPSGDVLTIHFMSYQGVTASTLEGLITPQLENQGCKGWLSFEIQNMQENVEGDFVFTFQPNADSQVRSVTFSATNTSFEATQEQERSAVYILSASKSIIAHGEDVSFTLSGSDSFAYYSLDRTIGGTTTTLATAQGTGLPLTFNITYAKDGTYSSTANSPVEVAMTGSPAVSFYPFYGYIHSTSLSDNVVTLSKNGEKKTIPFTPNPSSNISNLSSILSKYNAGNSRCWNKSFQISYSSGYLTVVCPMNTGTSYTSTITDSTYFIINSAGSTLIFRQDGGGSLQSYVLSPVIVSGEKILQLSSSQPLVTYRLYKDGQRYSRDSTIGTGEILRFSYPHTIGKYTVKAFYQGDSLVMNGGTVIVSGDRMLANNNWILKDTYTNNSGTEYVSDITYYDCLGYPEQVIQVKGSPTGRNITTPLWYDSVRRSDARTYLPFASPSSDYERENTPFATQKAYYQALYGVADTAYTYTQKVYEPSPLNRVTATFNAGAVFRSADKHASYGYDANATGEVLLLSVNSDNTLSAGGYFTRGRLYKNTVTDEDGASTITFTNTDGKTVLQRRIISSSPVSYADTYTVYDNLQRVAWVIPPEGSRLLSTSTVWMENDTVAAKHCYTYIYNGKGELSEKRLPGTGKSVFIYDPAGRQVALQDSVLRRDGRWLVTLYDSLSRPVKIFRTGASVTRAALETQFAANPYPAIYSDSGNTLTAEYQYGKPVSATFAFAPESGYVSPSDRYKDSTGMKTYEKILNINTLNGTPAYVERAFYYDYRGRIIQTVEKNINGGIDRTSFKYNFVGNILARQERVTPTSGGTETVKNTLYTYDQRGRLLTETTTVNGTAQGTVSYAYDDLGKLITKTGGNGVTEHTTYNLQGWTTAKNTLNASSANIFSQQLAYYNPQKGTTPLYTGNISEWTVAQGANATSTFGFSYDNLGRLTNTNRYVGAGATASSTFTERNLSYDANGNILTLSRYGASAATPEDNFTYTYNGNRLMNLAGTNGGTALSGANYAYDGNGNMTHDGRMNLDVTYDIFGMPQSVQQNGTLKCCLHLPCRWNKGDGAGQCKQLGVKRLSVSWVNGVQRRREQAMRLKARTLEAEESSM
jgi:YD repeat-containing protein